MPSAFRLAASYSYNNPYLSAVAQAMTDQPEPTPTLKEEALAILAAAGGPDCPQQMTVLNTDQHILIRRALEALPQ